MSTQEERLTEIANAIRYAEGSTALIPALSFAARIRALSGGGGSTEDYTLQVKTATPTKNQQLILPDSAYYGLSSVTVEAIPDKYQDVSGVTAGAADVLAGKVLVDAAGNPIAGSMTNNGAVNITVESGSSYNIPEGYHNGDGKVTAVGGESSGGTEERYAEITVGSEDESMGSVTGSGTYGIGETATLEATHQEGTYFLGWYENDELISSDNPFLYVIPSPDKVFTAKFRQGLPLEYTELSALYKKGSGQTSLGIPFTQNTRIDVDLTVVSSSTTSYTVLIWGFYSSTTANRRLFGLYKTYYKTLYLANGSSTVNVTVPDLQNVRSVLSVDYPNGTLSVNDVVYSTEMQTYMSPFDEVYLTPVASSSYYLRANFHRITVYESGNKQNDFVPCQDSSGNVGFYDMIQNNFIQLDSADWTAVA